MNEPEQSQQELAYFLRSHVDAVKMPNADSLHGLVVLVAAAGRSRHGTHTPLIGEHAVLLAGAKRKTGRVAGSIERRR